MQDSVDLPPNASSMIESMRDIGYSFPAAIADIVDNSLSAKAQNIRIHFLWNEGDPVVAIADDGIGMTDEELKEAMRPGSQSPRENRQDTDLGRFGLGLKTASFSQGRCLSVVSMEERGIRYGYRWDLDHVAETNTWSVHRLSNESIQALPFAELLDGQPSGTLVVWERIDRLMDFTSTRAEDLFNDHFEQAREHLELVFHRFIEPMADERRKPRINIEMNGIALEAFNPFFPNSPARQMLQAEEVEVEGQKVLIQPYVLPHHSRVDKDSYQRYGGKDGYAHSQGFYVYRNRRLIDHGTWFRLVSKKEITRLARVRVDIPNTLDHLWGIDVRKSRATPPGVIRDALKRVIGRITEKAQKVYTHRGRKEISRETAPIWQRYQRHGEIHYAVNRVHPLLEGVYASLDVESSRKLDVFLKLVGENLPSEMIFSDMSGDPSSLDHSQVDDIDRLKEDLVSFINVLRESGLDDNEIKNHLTFIKPYASRPDLVEKVMEAES